MQLQSIFVCKRVPAPTRPLTPNFCAGDYAGHSWLPPGTYGGITDKPGSTRTGFWSRDHY